MRSSFGSVDSPAAPAAGRRRGRPPRPAGQSAAPPATDTGALWAERHGPADCRQLAVPRAKVEELERWLADTGRRLASGAAASPFLLLTGPAGCGKSAAVRCLADKLGLTLLQWTTPSAARHQRERALEGRSDGRR